MNTIKPNPLRTFIAPEPIWMESRNRARDLPGSLTAPAPVHSADSWEYFIAGDESDAYRRKMSRFLDPFPSAEIDRKGLLPLAFRPRS